MSRKAEKITCKKEGKLSLQGIGGAEPDEAISLCVQEPRGVILTEVGNYINGSRVGARG
ncbi:MAG: hypothetical protein HYW33_01535 [Candidatus Blackburnbacteria bacterium]|nr:hypothetical protein [Candidatus Blackburnbacteria bacterium]